MWKYFINNIDIKNIHLFGGRYTSKENSYTFPALLEEKIYRPQSNTSLMSQYFNNLRVLLFNVLSAYSSCFSTFFSLKFIFSWKFRERQGSQQIPKKHLQGENFSGVLAELSILLYERKCGISQRNTGDDTFLEFIMSFPSIDLKCARRRSSTTIQVQQKWHYLTHHLCARLLLSVSI